jgi:ribonuclease P protein component
MYKFSKEERLCSVKLLERLFSSGSSFLVYPFRVTFLPGDYGMAYPAQVMIGVSKRRFKRAVDRNLIKRRIREVYRLQKGTLLYPALTAGGTQIIFAVNYVGKEITEYSFLERKMRAALTQLITLYAERSR